MKDAATLVEDSLNFIDGAGVSDGQFRSIASALYEFESNYVSRATYFRLMDVLEERDYFVTVPIESHPAWGEHAEAIAPDEDGSIEPVFESPGQPWSEESNPIVAYVQDETLYVEAGSQLWQSLVDDGAISGEAAEAIDEKSLFAAVADVCELADNHAERELLLRWYVALGFHLGMELDDEDAQLDELKAVADLERIRRLVNGVDDLEMTLHHPKRDLDIPPPPLREAHPILGWWYDLM